MICRVVNLHTDPSGYDIYIGRAGHGQDGYFGNPYRMGHHCPRCKQPHPTPDTTIDCYRAYFEERIHRDHAFRERVRALRGKVLGCFCKPKPCHGDVLADYVNRFFKDPSE